MQLPHAYNCRQRTTGGTNSNGNPTTAAATDCPDWVGMTSGWFELISTPTHSISDGGHRSQSLAGRRSQSQQLHQTSCPGTTAHLFLHTRNTSRRQDPMTGHCCPSTNVTYTSLCRVTPLCPATPSCRVCVCCTVWADGPESTTPPGTHSLAF